MGTSCYQYNELTIAPGELESELLLRRLESRGGNNTPKFDATPTSSPFVATPSAPQRVGVTRRQSGGGALCPDDSASALLLGDALGGTRRTGDDLGGIHKDLLVIALEEENDRLRSVLESERQRRQLAEARAREFQHQAIGLASQLAEVQQKLEQLEQEAVRRAMVQTWLDSTTPQRRGSVDQGPDGSLGAGSAVLVEARVCTEPAALTALDAAKLAKPPPPSPPPLTFSEMSAAREAEACADEGVCGAACAALAGDGAGISSSQLYDGAGLYDCACGGSGGRSGSMTVATAADEGCPVGPAGLCASPAAPHPAHGYCHISRRAEPWGAAATTSTAGGLQAAWTASASASPLLQRSCTAVGGAHGDGGGGGGCGGLSPQWNLPLQDEKEWPEAVPLTPGEDAGEKSHTQPGSGGRPAPVDSGPPTSALKAAANVWMPAGAALCHNWGLEPLPGHVQKLSSQLPPGQFSIVLAPGGGPQPQPYAQACAIPHPVLHQQAAPWSGCGSGPPRGSDLSRLRGSSAILRSAFNAAAASGGGFDGAGDGAAAMESCGSAPVGAQDGGGGEWCTIPLGSPVRTPRKGTSPHAGNP